MWVSPFRHPRLIGYLLLPAAFRSLSRLSSALSAKASTLCPFLLGLLDILLCPPFPYSVIEMACMVSHACIIKYLFRIFDVLVRIFILIIFSV